MTHDSHLIYVLESLILILSILFMELFTIIQSDVHNLFIYESLKATVQLKPISTIIYHP